MRRADGGRSGGPAAVTMPAAPRPARAAPARSAHALVTQGIGRDIVEGRYAAGSTLPGDADLMERFRVSRTALREGLKTLAAKGLIESKTKVGTRVLDPKRWNMFDAEILGWRVAKGDDPAFLASLFAIRQVLEPLGAAAAALSRTDGDLAALESAWATMRRPDHSRDSFTAADVQFHRAVLDASANPFLQSIGAVIEAALASAFALSAPIDSRERFDLSGRQHRAVLDAIRARDPQAASAAMSAVILQGATGAKVAHARAPRIDIPVALLGLPTPPNPQARPA